MNEFHSGDGPSFVSPIISSIFFVGRTLGQLRSNGGAILMIAGAGRKLDWIRVSLSRDDEILCHSWWNNKEDFCALDPAVLHQRAVRARSRAEGAWKSLHGVLSRALVACRPCFTCKEPYPEKHGHCGSCGRPDKRIKLACAELPSVAEP